MKLNCKWTIEVSPDYAPFHNTHLPEDMVKFVASPVKEVKAEE